MTGIYMITFGNDENAHYYIGQSVALERRKNDHLNKLKNGTHENTYMQRVFNKYGEKSMTFEILCKCSADKLDELEEYYIFTMQTFVGDGMRGLNLNTGGNGNHNISEETRKKMSEAKRMRIVTAETKAKLSKLHKGKPLSEEHKQKISEALKGTGHLKGKGTGHLKGKTLSEEHKQKISETRRRKPVLCVELGKTFHSIEEASRFMEKEFGLAAHGLAAHVSEILNGRRKTAGGFHWEHCSPKEED